MPAEATDAPAIVAVEKSSTDRTLRERCRCITLVHMSGLFECHAEFRESLLRSGHGGGGGGGWARDERRRSTRLHRWRPELSNGRDACNRRVWRQRPAVGMPVHQVRVGGVLVLWWVFGGSVRRVRCLWWDRFDSRRRQFAICFCRDVLPRACQCFCFVLFVTLCCQVER